MRRAPQDATAGAAQLRLPLTPPCEWHALEDARASGAAPCARDAQVLVADPVRGRLACCCTPHALTLVGLWRQSVPNRRRNAGRVVLAWLPDVPRRVALPPVIGRRRRALA